MVCQAFSSFVVHGCALRALCSLQVDAFVSWSLCVWMLAERSDGGDNWARCLPSEEGCDEIVSSAIESAGEGSSNQLLREEHAAVLAKAAQDSAGFLAEMLKESQVTPTC